MKQLLTLFLILLHIGAYGQVQKYSRLKVYLEQPDHTMDRLLKLGIDIDHGILDNNNSRSFTGDFSAEDVGRIRAAGFNTEVIVEDVVAGYLKAYNEFQKSAEKPQYDESDPEQFRLGSYSGYYTYDELLATLDQMHQRYPKLITSRRQIDTFNSIEGRPLYWLRVSDNAASEQPLRPQVLYTALHHAREPGSISQMVYFLWYLLENYEKNEKVKAILDHTELYFIPCVNPDGYVYNITTSPAGGGMWRKNRRRNDNGTYGVDLNRNYGYGWNGPGSSANTTDDLYHGTGPFSEPETQAVKWFTYRVSLRRTTSTGMVIPDRCWGI